MIVNPQSFNYRLIIGSLIIAVAVLTVYSFTSYKSIVAHQQFLEQEKKLVESELSQMITRYDDVSISNDLITSQLEDAKKNTQIALDSLRLLRSDLSVISKFKQQLFNFKARGFEKFFGAKRSSTKAKRVHSIEVCFTLAENSLTEAGNKEVYIQILNPRNNVVADKGAVSFGDSSLIYSAKEIINYSNQVVEVCLDVDADIDEQPLVSGTYYISIFHEDRKLGSTQVKLK